MADTIDLNASPRTAVRHGVKALRRSGMVPAVVYGHKIEPVPIQLNTREVTNILRRAGRNRLISLNLGDGASARMVLAREVQRDPIKGVIQHIDFYEVSMTEKITAEVRILTVGEPADVKTGAGVLLQEMNVLAIRCLPTDLIESVSVDVSGLAIDGVIRVRDIQVPQGIEVMDDPDEDVVRVTRFVEAAAEEPAPAETTEVEVIEKGKKEEEEAEE